MSSTAPRPIPPVPTEVSPELEAAANEEYDAYVAAAIAEAEAEPLENYITLEECWTRMCERFPWLVG